MSVWKNSSSGTSKKPSPPKEGGHPSKKKAKQKSRKPRKIEYIGTGSVDTQVLGTGVFAPSLQKVAWSVVPDKTGQTALCRSTDYVGSITIPAGAVVGQCITAIPLTPYNFASTRLSQQAGLWEKFQVLDWKFTLVTTQGTTSSGQIVAFVDPDPEDVWSTAAAPYNLNRGAAQFGALPMNIWQNGVVSLSRKTNAKQWFYVNYNTNTAQRWAYPGQFVVLYGGGATNTTDLTIYNIFMTVSLRFANPEIDNSTGPTAKLNRIAQTLVAPIATSANPVEGTITGGVQQNPGYDVDATTGNISVTPSAFPNADVVVDVITQVTNAGSNVLQAALVQSETTATQLVTGTVKLLGAAAAGSVASLASRYLVPAGTPGTVQISPLVASVVGGTAGAVGLLTLGETEVVASTVAAGAQIEELRIHQTAVPVYDSIQEVAVSGGKFTTVASVAAALNGAASVPFPVVFSSPSTLALTLTFNSYYPVRLTIMTQATNSAGYPSTVSGNTHQWVQVNCNCGTVNYFYATTYPMTGSATVTLPVAPSGYYVYFGVQIAQDPSTYTPPALLRDVVDEEEDIHQRFALMEKPPSRSSYPPSRACPPLRAGTGPLEP